MKRIISGLLSLILILMLCACGSKVSTTWQEQYDLGMQYLSDGNYEEAIIAFNAAIEIDPKRTEAYLSLADAYIATEDYESARATLERALEQVDDIEVIQRKLDEIEELIKQASGAENVPIDGETASDENQTQPDSSEQMTEISTEPDRTEHQDETIDEPEQSSPIEEPEQAVKSTYLVTFDPNGGEVTPSSVTIDSGDAIKTLPTPTRTGYVFDGWYSSPNGGSEITASTTIVQEQTLYAHWTQSVPSSNVFTCKIEAGDGLLDLGEKQFGTATLTVNSDTEAILNLKFSDQVGTHHESDYYVWFTSSDYSGYDHTGWGMTIFAWATDPSSCMASYENLNDDVEEKCTIQCVNNDNNQISFKISVPSTSEFRFSMLSAASMSSLMESQKE